MRLGVIVRIIKGVVWAIWKLKTKVENINRGLDIDYDYDYYFGGMEEETK